jgi:hypothetical protein
MLIANLIPEIVEEVFAGVHAAQAAGFLVGYPKEIEIEMPNAYGSTVRFTVPVQGRMLSSAEVAVLFQPKGVQA